MLLVLAGALLRPILFVDMVLMDDLTLVPAVTGAEPMLGHLFASHNGHRLVLPRLLQIVSIWLLGDRLWAPRFLALLALLAATAIFLSLLRRARGRLALVDVVIPLLFLSPRLVSTFVHAFDLQFAMHTTLLALALWFGWRGVRGSKGAILGVALALVALALSGMNGLIAGATFAPFVAAHAFDWGREPARRRANWLAPLLVGMSWLGLGLLMTWETALPGSGSHVGKWVTTLQFLAMGFGPAGARFWPLSGWVAGGFVLATLLMLGPSRGAGDAADRREVGLLRGAVVASLAVAAAVGWGRAGWGGSVDAGLGERFTLLSSGVLALGHLVFVTALRGGKPGRALPVVARFSPVASWAMLALLVSALPTSFSDARRRAHEFAEAAREIAEGAQLGIPVSTLAERNARVFAHDRGELARFISLLCEHRLGPYRGIEPGRVSCGISALESRTLETSAGGAEVVETSYAVLAEHDAACGPLGERFGPSCARAASAFCNTRGYEAGFGPVENSGPIAIVICARAARVEVEWSDLSRVDANCHPNGSNEGACPTAVHRLCVARGARTGLFVPPSAAHVGKTVAIVCFEAELQLPVVSFRQLEREHGACVRAEQARNADCAAAIHRLCGARGNVSGFGPVALEAGQVTAACLTK